VLASISPALFSDGTSYTCALGAKGRGSDHLDKVQMLLFLSLVLCVAYCTTNGKKLTSTAITNLKFYVSDFYWFYFKSYSRVFLFSDFPHALALHFSV
jgi:hypothetical protein